MGNHDDKHDHNHDHKHDHGHDHGHHHGHNHAKDPSKWSEEDRLRNLKTKDMVSRESVIKAVESALSKVTQKMNVPMNKLVSQIQSHSGSMHLTEKLKRGPWGELL